MSFPVCRLSNHQTVTPISRRSVRPPPPIKIKGESQRFFCLLGLDFFLSSLSRFLPPRVRLVVRRAGGALGAVRSSSTRGRCSTASFGSRISSLSGFGRIADGVCEVHPDRGSSLFCTTLRIGRSSSSKTPLLEDVGASSSSGASRYSSSSSVSLTGSLFLSLPLGG